MTSQVRDIVALITIAARAILSVVYADTDFGQVFAAVRARFQYWGSVAKTVLWARVNWPEF